MKLDMSASPITLNQIIAVVIGLVVLVSSGLAWYYHREYRRVSDDMLILKHDVAETNKAAAAKLVAMTIERDSKQAILDQQYKERGEKDEIAKNGIARIDAELRASTVRVRVEPASGCSGSGSTSDKAPSAENSAGNDTEAYGVLPRYNTERLAVAIAEIETLSAAYNSCRAVEISAAN